MKIVVQRKPYIEIVIVVGIAAIIFAILAPNPLPDSGSRFKRSRVLGDMRSIAVALEAYAIDHRALPPAIPMPAAGAAAVQMIGPHLTTPVAYLVGSPTDPGSPDRQWPYAYFTDGKGWILYSVGYDGDYDLIPSKVYDGSTTQPSPLLEGGPWTYDPTNGTDSSGDIWRTR
jgi:type II secretory pathway pseudopilin PulG